MTETQTRTLAERVGDRFRERRQAMRLSLDEAAERTGMSKTNLWQIEEAKGAVSLAFAYQLARFYGVTLDWLTMEDSKP